MSRTKCIIIEKPLTKQDRFCYSFSWSVSSSAELSSTFDSTRELN